MKRITLLFTALFMAIVASAQVDEVTLTVLGTGVNEEKATLQALRSAIEQSFGTFVSANTTILNDKLVQDEIVSVSNGNVKEYKKLAVAALPNGQVSVSVKATVSINKLISYAKSKGSRAEFAGQTFAANVKLMKLRSESARKTYELMVQQLELIARDMFDFEISIESPIHEKDHTYAFDGKVNVYSNTSSSNFSKLYTTTCEALKMTREEVQEFANANIETGYYDQIGSDNRIYLPFSDKTLLSYRDRIKNAIFKSLFRYKIQEIGNPKNTYYWKVKDDKRVYASQLYGDNNGYLLFNTHFNEYRPNANLREATSKFKQSSYKYICIIEFIAYEDLLIEEIKRPIELSSKQRRALEKGEYTGPTCTTTYGPQKLIYSFPIKVKVDENMIDRCQGFELIGVSAPTNKAK